MGGWGEVGLAKATSMCLQQIPVWIPRVCLGLAAYRLRHEISHGQAILVSRFKLHWACNARSGCTGSAMLGQAALGLQC